MQGLPAQCNTYTIKNVRFPNPGPTRGKPLKIPEPLIFCFHFNRGPALGGFSKPHYGTSSSYFSYSKHILKVCAAALSRVLWAQSADEITMWQPVHHRRLSTNLPRQNFLKPREMVVQNVPHSQSQPHLVVRTIFQKCFWMLQDL